MPLASIEQLLKRHMGLDAASIGSSAISRAVQQRMQARNLATIEDYLGRLRSSPAELHELIELVVVPETWFYRDSKPFEALRRHAQKHWRTRSAGNPVRLLSLPCSTGEEPYTLAMTLLDAGLRAEQFHIDAVDISEANLRRARAGLYREHAFRNDDLSFRDRHFIRNEAGYLLNADIRKSVNFLQGNLLDPQLLQREPVYDVIFCRNLLIYFDRQTQQRALDALERHLATDGLLFLGHAEAGVVSDRNYSALDYQRCFAFTRSSGANTSPWQGSDIFRMPRRTRQTRPAKPRTTAKTRQHPTPADTMPPAERHNRLEEATRLANGGHLAEAAALCEQHLKESGPESQAFYLLALLREAVGEPDEAEQYLRKALYLEPDHYEALTHLALLLSQRGDAANAELLRQRAKRSFERRAAEAARGAGGS